MGTVIVIHHTGRCSLRYQTGFLISHPKFQPDCGMTYLDEKGFQARTEAKHPDFTESHPGYVYGAIDEYVLFNLGLGILLTFELARKRL